MLCVAWNLGIPRWTNCCYAVAANNDGLISRFAAFSESKSRTCSQQPDDPDGVLIPAKSGVARIFGGTIQLRKLIIVLSNLPAEPQTTFRSTEKCRSSSSQHGLSS